METPTDSFPQLADASKQLTQRAMVICENRIELLMVEVQEERERVLRAILLALSAAVFGLLAGVALTALIAVLFWQTSPLLALVLLTVLYSGVTVVLYRRLARLQHGWQMLPATIDQFKKGLRMFGKTTELTPLEARKQLLLVESELNRVQLVNELRELKHGLQGLKTQVEAVSSIAATAAKWAETFTQIRGAFSHAEKPEGDSSWLGRLFHGVQTCAALFKTFRSRSA